MTTAFNLHLHHKTCHLNHHIHMLRMHMWTTTKTGQLKTN